MSENTEGEETTGTVETNDENEAQLYDIIEKRLVALSNVKFAAYRVGCKLRLIQKYLKLTYVDYNILVRAFNTHQLQFGVENRALTYENAREVLIGIYQLISSYHFNEASMDEVVDTLLRILSDILQIETKKDIDLNSFKILLFALSNAKLPEKYRCFFRQITSPNVIASQGKLTELFGILLKIPNHFDQVESFHSENIPGCVQSCLDHTHDGIIREDIFVNWMSREPQTLVWLPTLHRLIVTETVRHEARCNTCKAYPVIGMRYRCLRCFNYDLCQTCFFTGDHAKKHDGTHPIEEYCKQVTPFEDLKAFLEFMKLKVGKRELRRKERYLSIERSKSFIDTPITSSITSSSPLIGQGHHSLARGQVPPKKIDLQDIYRPIPKNDDTFFNNATLQQEETMPLTGYDNVPIDLKKKLTSPLKKKLTKDEPLLQEELAPVDEKNSSLTQRNNYVNLEPRTKSATLSDDEGPMLLPKQHLPMKKSLLIKQKTEVLIQSEHYQLPPKDSDHRKEEKEEYQPPLPPKQRHQQNTSRALVYDFIGSELQELRETLAQFNGTTSHA